MQKYGKVYRLRKKSSIFRNRFFWSSILILMLLSGVFYLVSFSSFFQIKEIEISGNSGFAEASADQQKVFFEDIQILVEKTIEKKILFFSSKSIFLVNLNEIRERILKEFPQIAKVDLRRDFPDKILIQIEEKKPIAIFCQTQNVKECFFIDEEGMIIEFISGKDILELTKIIGNVETPNLGTRVIGKDYLDSILEIQKKLSLEQKIEIKEFIPSEEKLTVQTLEGWQIFFELSGNISDQILNLTVLLKEKIPPENRRDLEYIDLRFGDKIYFKYR